jgi:hypothetical protein
LRDVLHANGFPELGDRYPVPDYQTVFYVDVPDDLDGDGNLIVYDPDPNLIIPENNKLIKFTGGLTHEVTEIKTAGTRITLFTEQYKVDPADWIMMQNKFIDDGTMYEISILEESKDERLEGEFWMPYDD